jgi:hypothetical protein
MNSTSRLNIVASIEDDAEETRLDSGRGRTDGRDIRLAQQTQERNVEIKFAVTTIKLASNATPYATICTWSELDSAATS